MAATSPTDDAAASTSKQTVRQLSWYDLIFIAVLSLGAFGIGGFTAGHAGSLAGPPVSSIAVFQADAGVPVATNNLGTVNSILGKLQDQIASGYVSSVGAGTGTTVNSKTVAKLQAADQKMVAKQSLDQIALAKATDRAATAQSSQLSARHRKEIIIRVISSAVCLLVLAVLIFLVSALSRIRAAWLPLLGCALMLLLAFLIADVTTWVAGLFLLFLVVVVIIRDRGKQGS
jgi:hypothetical protein